MAFTEVAPHIGVQGLGGELHMAGIVQVFGFDQYPHDDFAQLGAGGCRPVGNGWIVVGAVPLVLFARNEKRRYHARTIARRVESYSGPEVPLRWLCNSVGMDTKDLAWYFENGYFVNLSLDLNQKIVRRRTVPRHDPNRS